MKYHIPAYFTAACPPVTFTQKQHHSPASQHLIAPLTNQYGSEPQVYGDNDAIRHLTTPPGAPRTVAEYVNAELPQIGVHVVRFTDATIITVSWPHTFSDLLGMREFMGAWTSVISNPHAKICEPYQIYENPLETLGENPTELYQLSALRMSNWALTKFLVRHIPVYFLSKRVSRSVYVPADFVSSLRQMAYSSTGHLCSKTAFLSEGDVLFAWWAKIVLQSRRARNETVQLNTVASRRKIFSQSHLRSDRVYLSNAIGLIPTIITGADLLQRPIGWTASQIRESIQLLHHREQMEAYEAVPTNFSLRMPPALGDSIMYVVSATNWTKADLYDLDFTQAAYEPPAATRFPSGSMAVKPTMVQGFIEDGLYQALGPLFIIIKDKRENYYISGYARKGLWNRIDRNLAFSQGDVNMRPRKYDDSETMALKVLQSFAQLSL